ncbi:hypothetical protein ABW19_dt0210213 [Dactylella cylindrospora]|nr:hypothetical protein ABW19_dt0210213 [Dactylella cylindrospora]
METLQNPTNNISRNLIIRNGTRASFALLQPTNRALREDRTGPPLQQRQLLPQVDGISKRRRIKVKPAIRGLQRELKRSLGFIFGTDGVAEVDGGVGVPKWKG